MDKSYACDKPNRSEAGFTLFETTIAMVLMAIVGLGVAGCFFYAARNNSSARDRELAMAVAQQQIEQMRNLSFNDAGLAATAGTNTTVIRGGRKYQVNTTIENSNVQNSTVRTKKIQIKVVPVSDDLTRNATSIFGAVTVVCERTSQSMGPNRQF
jgi:Tfp pilus assembly protein PilV